MYSNTQYWVLIGLILTILFVSFFNQPSAAAYSHMHPSYNSSEPDQQFPFGGMSFHASGWMQVFQGGVAKYIQEKYQLDKCKMVGTSGGAIVACTLCCDIPMDLAFSEILGVRNINKHNNVFRMCEYTKQVIKKMLPINCIELMKNRLTIVCSKMENVNLVPMYASAFNSYDDVLNYLNATVHIPIFDGFFPQVTDAHNLYDGMLTDSHSPILDPCLKVTWDSKCYCGCTQENNTIFPEIEIPHYWCMYPPDERILELLYYHGYYVAQKYFLSQTREEDKTNSEKVLVELCNEIHRQRHNNLIIQGSLFFAVCMGSTYMI